MAEEFDAALEGGFFEAAEIESEAGGDHVAAVRHDKVDGGGAGDAVIGAHAAHHRQGSGDGAEDRVGGKRPGRILDMAQHQGVKEGAVGEGRHAAGDVGLDERPQAAAHGAEVRQIAIVGQHQRAAGHVEGVQALLVDGGAAIQRHAAQVGDQTAHLQPGSQRPQIGIEHRDVGGMKGEGQMAAGQIVIPRRKAEAGQIEHGQQLRVRGLIEQRIVGPHHQIFEHHRRTHIAQHAAHQASSSAVRRARTRVRRR